MKIIRKSFLVLSFLLCVAGFSFCAYALIYAYSDPVHVDINYTVELSAATAGSQVTLTATVKNNGSPVGAGIQVDFFDSVDGGTYYDFAYAYTDSTGVAQVTYAAAYNGSFDFKAIATIP